MIKSDILADIARDEAREAVDARALHLLTSSDNDVDGAIRNGEDWIQSRLGRCKALSDEAVDVYGWNRFQDNDLARRERAMRHAKLFLDCIASINETNEAVELLKTRRDNEAEK